MLLCKCRAPPVPPAEASVTQSRALPQTPLLHKEDRGAPLSSSASEKRGYSQEEPHTPEPAGSLAEHRLDHFTLPCCRMHSPFFSHHGDVAMTSPVRSLVQKSLPVGCEQLPSLSCPWPGQAPSLTRTCTQTHVGTARGQGHLRCHTLARTPRWGASWSK